MKLGKWFERFFAFVKLHCPKEVAIFGGLFFCFGLLFVFVTPPVYVVDESAHFYRALQVSEHNFIPDNIGNEAGGALPYAATEFVARNMLGPKDKYNPFVDRKKTADLKTGTGTKNDVVEFTNVAIYPPTNYIPQAVGMNLARIFTQKILVQFYVARVTNLLFLTLSLVVACCLLPYARRAFMMVCSLPMVLYVGASLSADTFVIASVALFVALLMRVMSKRRITTGEWVTIAIFAIMVALSKQTYILLTLSLLMIPLRKYRSKGALGSDFLRVGFVLIGAAAFLALWLLMIRGLNTQPIHLQHTVGIVADPSLQVNNIVHAPLHFMHVVLTSLNNPGVINGFLAWFGVSDIMLPAGLYFLLVIVLFLALGVRDVQRITVLGRRLTVMLLSVVALHIMTVFAGLFIYWTAPNQPIISSVQGRYFLPDLIILFPLLVGRYRHTIPPFMLALGVVFVWIASVVAIFARFH